MPPTTTSPADVGAYAPPAQPPPGGAPDDTPTAADVTATMRVARWLWQKRELAYLAGIAITLWGPPGAPRVTTPGAATSHDSVQDARLAAHLAYADTAATSLRVTVQRIERLADASIRIGCRGLTPGERELVDECVRRTPSGVSTSLVMQAQSGEVR